jgi:sn-glycerol 3-phosphate transport system ATP-binding protein
MNLLKTNGGVKGVEGVMGVRPENVRLNKGVGGREATVESVEYLGADSLVAARMEDQPILVRVPGHARMSAGDKVSLAWNAEDEHHFDANTGGRKE